MRILLCRHGETLWNVQGRYQGQTDVPLSEAGETQAKALGDRLKSLAFQRAVSSPLARARRTAELALNGQVAGLQVDPALQEIAHGTWEGLLATDLREQDPERVRAWRETPDLVQMPGGESLPQVLDRAWPAFQRACQGLGPQDLLLMVAHDAVNRVLLCRILGLPLRRLWAFRQAPTTVNLLEGPDVDRLEVVRLNDCSHLTGFFGEAVHRAL